MSDTVTLFLPSLILCACARTDYMRGVGAVLSFVTFVVMLTEWILTKVVGW